MAEGPPGGKMQLPTDQEVDQALDYLERVYKKFRDHVKDLDKPQAPPVLTHPHHRRYHRRKGRSSVAYPCASADLPTG